MLQKFFKPKKGKITEITVTGNLVEGGSTVNITEDDIPDDIKELIEMGLYSEEEAEKKIAVGNGSRERRMIVVKPDITYVGTGDDRKPTVAFEDGNISASPFPNFSKICSCASFAAVVSLSIRRTLA